MTYQFRVQSINEPAELLSYSEELRDRALTARRALTTPRPRASLGA
jgi:hypothetical protein